MIAPIAGVVKKSKKAQSAARRYDDSDVTESVDRHRIIPESHLYHPGCIQKCLNREEIRD